ncbi:Crp/Fnr family transcriptional regulator, partial [Ruminococcus sp.]
CAKEQCTVLFLSPESIIKESSTLTARLLKITAMKNLRLNEKIQVITPRTIRERVMAYLSSLAKKSGSHIVTTNFDRQQLADFLCVDRSALSTELGKMHREGLIDLKGREFILPENCSRGT